MCGWEVLPMPSTGEECVRRLKVPGGWLYQVEHRFFLDPVESRPGFWAHGWHAPVFVPEQA